MDHLRRHRLASRRPDPETDTHIQVVLQFKTWEITKLEGKENLTWSGVLELYWCDAPSTAAPGPINCPRISGVLHDWERRLLHGDAEKGTKLPTFNDSRKERRRTAAASRTASSSSKRILSWAEVA